MEPPVFGDLGAQPPQVVPLVSENVCKLSSLGATLVLILRGVTFNLRGAPIRQVSFDTIVQRAVLRARVFVPATARV